MHHTSENNKAGRAEFVFFGIILKIPNVRIRWLYYWGECIYLLHWLPSHTPGSLPKLEVMISGGKQKNKCINFIFVVI